MAGFGFAMIAAPAAGAWPADLAARGGTTGRVLALTGLAALLRTGAGFALRAAGFAALRGAVALRGAAFAAGFLGRATFLAGIKFSAAYEIERRIIAPVSAGSSAGNSAVSSRKFVRAG
jgi:hypothetical protein